MKKWMAVIVICLAVISLLPSCKRCKTCGTEAYSVNLCGKDLTAYEDAGGKCK